MHRRGLVILCLIAAAGILYGSLMPFQLDAGEDQVRAKIRWFLRQWPLGPGHVSRLDIIANVALYLPLGLLLALAVRPKTPGRRLATIPLAAVLGLTLSTIVESVQLFLQGRVSSPSDLVMNTIGTAIGAVLGVTAAPPVWRSLRRRFRDTWRDNPLAMMGILLAGLLVADALFPLLPTLDVGQFRQSLQRSTLDPLAGWRIHPWHHWLLRRLLPWAALAALLSSPQEGDSPGRPLRVAGWVVLLAAACEVGKLFIISRTANATNVLVTVLAAGAGSALGSRLVRRVKPRSVLALGGTLLIGYLAYIAWTPFTFRWSMELAAGKWPTGARWLPMYHYAMGARPEDVRLFLRSVCLLAGVSYCLIGARTPRPGSGKKAMLLGSAMGFALGVVLEAGQLFLPSRVPSTTDLFCLALGGALGGWLVMRYPLVGRPADCNESSGTPCHRTGTAAPARSDTGP